MVASALGRALSVYFVLLASTQVDAEPFRLRIEWGGGANRSWQGVLEVDQGSFSQLDLLGLEADEPGTHWIETDSSIRIRQRTARSYDALDVSVDATADTVLTIDLAAERGQSAEPVRVPIADVLSGNINTPLDGQGNRLLIRQAPGEQIRIHVDRNSMVFAPEEILAVGVLPALNGIRPGASLRIQCTLTPARNSTELWSRAIDYSVPAGNEPLKDVPLEVPLPAEEGAYRLRLAIRENGLRQRFVPVVPARPLAERSIGLVVVDPQATPAPVRSDAKTDGRSGWLLVSEVDPINPRWWQRAVQFPKFGRLPAWPQGPLSSGHAERFEHSLGTMIRITRQPGQECWEAYPLEVQQVGAPHQLLLDFPSDVAQHLCISIIEPNAAGAVMPIGLDSGVFVSKDKSTQPAEMRSHRLTFWPRTQTPLVLITPRGETGVAVFHKLSVLAGPARLPRLRALPPQPGQRLASAYFDRPLFPENFSASGVFDAWSGQSIDDWQTFYQSGTRLIDYLNHVGYNGLFISVAADGSAIYPSQLLKPTPRYDTGQLAAEGQDPIRKDVLEMLLRLFDREHLAMIPAIDFSAPLPVLEEKFRRRDEAAAGMTWVGADGKTWIEHNGVQRGLAPYYNTLNSDVQQAMIDVVREMVQRYSHHPAMRGLALQLSAVGYAQLPGPEWGFDDQTVQEFQHDTGIQLPDVDGPERFARRAEILLGPKRQAWLTWRAEVLARFYRRLQHELAPLGSDAKLYLVGPNMFDGTHSKWQLRPTLPAQSTPADILLQLGILPDLYANDPHVVFLRPQRTTSPEPLPRQAIDLQVRCSTTIDRKIAAAAAPGALLYHPPQRTRLASFDRQSPFGEAKTYTLLVSQSSPAGFVNRRRFVRSIVDLDAFALVDGGWLLNLGQESAITPLLDVYRQLPAAKFKTVFARQPITVRTRTQGQDTYAYVANDSPWPTEVELRLDGPAQCTLSNLGDRSPATELAELDSRWKVTLAAYDLAAIRLSEPDVRVRVVSTESKGDPRGQLDQEITQLENRAADLANRPPRDLIRNPGFELPPGDGAIAGWNMLGNVGVAELDAEQHYGGSNSLKLTSSGGVASLRSELFDAPRTGRLALSVWLRVEGQGRTPVLRLAVEGPNDGRTFYRFAAVGGEGPDAVPLKSQWRPYLLPIDDIPSIGCEQLRVRFDMMDAGSVWIDDIELYDMKFTKTERVEISKILASARGALDNGALSDCRRQLENYWPRFLAENIPADPTPVVRVPRPALPAKPAASESPTMGERLRGYIPKFLQF